MPEFLELLAPDEAIGLIYSEFSPKPREEWVKSLSALGRVTFMPVLAPENLPAFPRSTVDGYAVRANDTFGASESLPAYLSVIGEVPMGKNSPLVIKTSQAALIHTGGMLPIGADAVVMVEYTQISHEDEIEVFKATAPGENILAVGEDVGAGQVVIPAGRVLRPAELGGLSALGIQSVSVSKKPQVAIISTGDELVPYHHSPRPGQVRDINTHTLCALIEQAGGLARPYGIIPDQASALKSTLSDALLTSDMVVITAGSSASTRDLTAEVIQSAGSPGVLVHGINIRPGKPTILALCDQRPVIGLPGNPVSALVIAWRFVVPLIHRFLGRTEITPRILRARLTTNLPSQTGREDWFPVRLAYSDSTLVAEPIFYKSNLIFSLANADGLLRIPPSASGIEAGQMADIHLLE